MTTIKVLDYHIKEGKKGSSRSCPIALAVKEIVGPEVTVMVGGDCITILKDLTIHSRVMIPIEASCFIGKFDFNEPVIPFSFDIPATFDPVQKKFVTDYDMQCDAENKR
jgi:hypothetical protein